MTSDRVYRTKLELSTAIEQLVNGRGTQFDPEIVNVFVKLLDNYDEMRKDLSNTYAKVVEGDVVNA